MNSITHRIPPRGFTRIELLALLLAVTGIAVLVLPVVAASRGDSTRAGCFNNLRLVGRAVEVWGTDHDGGAPWITRVSRGGTMPDSGLKAGNAWFEFTTLSNELATPRLLACPADGGVKVASEFSTVGGRGYMATGMRALATSYIINTDNLGLNPILVSIGDRNIPSESVVQCARGISNADSINLSFPRTTWWTNAVHGLAGHFLRTDGSVPFTGSAELLANGGFSLDDNGSFHYLRAR